MTVKSFQKTLKKFFDQYDTEGFHTEFWDNGKVKEMGCECEFGINLESSGSYDFLQGAYGEAILKEFDELFEVCGYRYEKVYSWLYLVVQN